MVVSIVIALALAAPATDGPMLREVGEGVYAALQPDERRFDDSNVVVFVGERALLIVDAPMDAEHVAAIAAEIRHRFDRPVRYLVNTHWHGDHTQGNAVLREAFGSDVVILGHRSLLADVPARAATALADQVQVFDREIAAAEDRLRRGVKRDGTELSESERPLAAAAIENARERVERNRSARFLAPDLAFDGPLRLDLGGLEVELLHLVAHTRGDVAVWGAAPRVLAAGDVVDDLPYVGHGYPRRWIAALDRLTALNPAAVVPGHGPVFEGTVQIALVRAFLDALVGAAQRASGTGASVAEAATHFDAARWRAELGRDDAAKRFFDAVLEEALARAFEEEELLADEVGER
jgi:cyclase